MENTQLTLVAILLLCSQVAMAYFLYRTREHQAQLQRKVKYQTREIAKIKQQFSAKKKFDRRIEKRLDALRSDLNIQNHCETVATPLSEERLQAKQGATKEQLIMDFGLEIAEADLIVKGYGVHKNDTEYTALI